MPYIAIKSFPKDEKTVKATVDRINQVMLETWGCPQEAITISVEEVSPEDWNEKVFQPEIQQNESKMVILAGQWKK